MDRLELRRKACEAVGYELRCGSWSNFGKRHFYIYLHGEIVENTGYYASADDPRWAEYLPAIESDPAVSEPLFLAWCEKNRWDSALETCPEGRPSCRILNRHTPPNQPIEQVAMAFGDTPSEARARCIVAAAQEEK